MYGMCVIVGVWYIQFVCVVLLVCVGAGLYSVCMCVMHIMCISCVWYICMMCIVCIVCEHVDICMYICVYVYGICVYMVYVCMVYVICMYIGCMHI